MSLILNQLAILLWKSWITRLRHWISTIFELLTPLLLALLIAYIYSYSMKTIDGVKDNIREEYEFRYEKEGQNNFDIPTAKPTPISIHPATIFGPDIQLENGRFSLPYHLKIAKIIYGPSNQLTDDLMRRAKDSIGISHLVLQPNKTGEEVDAEMESLVAGENVNVNSLNGVYGVIFDSNALSENRLIYTIRIFGEMTRLVNRVFPIKYSVGPADAVKPYIEEFCPLQIIINNAFVELVSSQKGSVIKVTDLMAKRFPYPPFTPPKEMATNFTLTDFIAASIVIGYVVLGPIIVKRITDEKVTKAKELLKMIGMSDWVFWGSHFINYLLIMVFHAIVFTFLYCYGWGGYPIIEHSNCLLFFAILMLYSIQSILFCMTLTTVFNRPVLAVIVTVILWIISYAVPFGAFNPIFHKEMDIIGTNKYRIISSFLPNMGLSWAMAIVGQMEIIGSGAQWSTLFRHTSSFGYMSLGLVMFTMIVSSIFYTLLIWYIDKVWPFQYGVPKSVFFPFTPSYWFPTKYRKEKGRDSPKNDLVIDATKHEREPDREVVISIKSLKKVFGGLGTQPKTAVNDLFLNIYDKQITALLGHNGAGKTTTMNMITGIFPPTSGTVLVNGYDIQYETSEARRSIGLCPQENIIYNELTVGQHLKLFAILKGYDWNSVDMEVKNTLDQLKLTDKMNAMAVSLSGGMKRKLALGIAMVGGTRILILDEPTSGLDPEARRIVWDLLHKLSTERTILLTTHYMEEADVLGDRIAIMCEGKIRCCGSPIFLKKRFGAGYHLRISKGFGFKSHLMEQCLQKYLPKAHLHSEIQSEVIYALESENTQNSTAVFPQMFDEIEKNKDKMGISSLGLTITTMEDVFIRVGNEFESSGDETLINPQKAKDLSLDPLVMKKPQYLTGFPLLLNQFCALLTKRFHFAKRYWPMMLFQLVVPGALFIMALLCDNAIRSSIKGESINLELNLESLYGNTFGFSKALDFPQFQNSYINTAKSHGMSTSTLFYENPNHWALNHSNNLEDYSEHYLIGVVRNQSMDQNIINAEVWYNNEALHSLPISINMFYESLLKSLLPKSDGQLVLVRNHPVNLSENTFNFVAVIAGWAITCLLLIPITVPFLGASYVLFPITERISKAKLIQLMTGLSSTLFWLSNFVFDLLTHSVVVLFIFIIFIVFDFNEVFFAQSTTALALLLLLFFFGFASIPLAYCFSLWLGKPSTGFAVLVIIFLVFGMFALLAMGALDLALNSFHNNIIKPKYFKLFLNLFRMIPVFTFGFGAQKVYRISSFPEVCKQMKEKALAQFELTCKNTEKGEIFYGCCPEKCGPNQCYDTLNPFGFDDSGIGIELAFLIGSGILFITIVLLFEIHWIRKLWYRMQDSETKRPRSSVPLVSDSRMLPIIDDSDVVAEKYRIEGLNERRKLSEEAMCVMNLSKKFGTFTAVDHLTFGIHKEECFGLLGVNGAGKTTTFSMLTGDLMLSDGNAFIADISLRDDLKSFQKQIGYCPQFDALLEKLTGVEMLRLFARLRGIPSDIIESEVLSLIEMVDLQKHAFKCTENYSGGNRRKLSLALAIIGCPPVIFLDEPTAGVDPTARRKIWSTLVYIQDRYQSAIVLTSHSMEECEALCSRLAIMVNGKFKCLGPTQHLRKKFGQGFTIIVKLKREVSEDNEHMTKVQDYIRESISSAILRDSHQGLLHFHITDPTVLWSHMFTVMERSKGELQMEDYLVSDTTLEQIFLSFAKTQR